jgi:cell division protein FtsB/cell division protein DivIC
VATNHPESKPFNSLESGVIPRRRHPRRRTTHFVVLLIAVVLFGNAVVGENGLIALLRANRELAETFTVLEALRSENDSFRDEVRMLLDEPLRVEEIARRELGLIKAGEKIFIVPSVSNVPER